MNKKYIFLVLMFISFFAQAQISCPNSIKTTGQSSTAQPIFIVSNGQNGCNENWPSNITVSGSLMYSLVSCNGGNLIYELNPPNQTPPVDFEITVDFGDGTICSYDSSGVITTLSSAEFEVYEVSIFPNPTSGILNIETDNSNVIIKVDVFSLIGKKVHESTSKTIDLNSLNSGIYLLEVQTNIGFSTHRIVKN